MISNSSSVVGGRGQMGIQKRMEEARRMKRGRGWSEKHECVRTWYLSEPKLSATTLSPTLSAVPPFSKSIRISNPRSGESSRSTSTESSLDKLQQSSPAAQTSAHTTHQRPKRMLVFAAKRPPASTVRQQH